MEGTILTRHQELSKNLGCISFMIFRNKGPMVRTLSNSGDRDIAFDGFLEILRFLQFFPFDEKSLMPQALPCMKQYIPVSCMNEGFPS